LLRSQFQDRLDSSPSRYIDEFVAGHPALLEQIDHGQQQLPAFRQKIS
jgi:hypothetical protein